jgi:polysaccharide export outer membrane protein
VKRQFHIVPIVAALIAGSLLAACSQSSGSAVTGAVSRPARPGTGLPPPDVPGTYATQTEYRVAPLDMLDVSVFQVPDLSRSVQVDASGRINLPLIGEVGAAGKTVEELQSDIAGRLGEKYLESPQVTVFVKESPASQVTVEGSVNKPGIFPIAGTTTLLQAVALSGGLSDTANAGHVTVFRTVQNQRMAAVFDVKAIRTGKATDPQVYGGDLIVAGESGMRAAFHTLGGVAPVIGVFGPLMY